MKPETLERIKKKREHYHNQAVKIMYGKSEYDGADGASAVLDMSDMIEQLIVEIEFHDET